MLNNDVLHQLKGLKQQIRDSRDIRTGVYRPSQSRYGFVKDDNGSDVFLPPDEASKLLPGDVVEIEVNEVEKDRIQGKVLKLVSSDFKNCHGYCIERGKGFFVEVDDVNHQWMFVPPKSRRGAKAGERVKASLLKHPFHNEGKGQLKIDELIGGEKLPAVETAYAISCFDVPNHWPDKAAEEVAAATEAFEAVVDSREISPYPFVSIDSAATRDIDDAVYCESNDKGWLLVAAIADPAAFISLGSTLDLQARKRGASIYFPHGPLAMLPEELSTNNCSLVPNKKRPAIICELQVSSDGTVSDVKFSLQTIVSAAKLNYFQVSEYLNHGTVAEELTPAIQHSLAASKMATDAIRTSRATDGLMNDNNRVDYRFRMNDKGKIDDLIAIERSSAHELVEEVMLSVNKAGAELLKSSNCPGPFSTHMGLRQERVTESKKLIEELAPDLADDTDPATIGGFNAVKAAAGLESSKALVRPFRRLLSRAFIKSAAEPHFGLGFDCYTTLTSPLRRYQDLLVNFQLHALLSKNEAITIDDAVLEKLQERLQLNRQAVRQCEDDLLCQFVSKLRDKPFDAEVVQLNGRSLTLRGLKNGVHGQLPSKALGKKWKYDALRGKISSDDKTINLGDVFEVTLDVVNEQRRTISYKLAEQSS